MDGLTGALEPMPGEWPVALCLIKVAAAIRSEPFARCICRDFSPKATLAPCTVSQVCGDPVSIHPNNPCTNLSSGTPTYQVTAVDTYYSVMAPPGQLLTSLRFKTYAPNGCTGASDMPYAVVRPEGSFTSVSGNSQTGESVSGNNQTGESVSGDNQTGESAEQGERRPPGMDLSIALPMQGVAGGHGLGAPG